MNTQNPGADKPPKTSSADMQGDDAGTPDSGATDSATAAAGVMKQTSKTPAEGKDARAASHALPQRTTQESQ